MSVQSMSVATVPTGGTFRVPRGDGTWSESIPYDDSPMRHAADRIEWHDAAGKVVRVSTNPSDIEAWHNGTLPRIAGELPSRAMYLGDFPEATS